MALLDVNRTAHRESGFASKLPDQNAVCLRIGSEDEQLRPNIPKTPAPVERLRAGVVFPNPEPDGATSALKGRLIRLSINASATPRPQNGRSI